MRIEQLQAFLAVAETGSFQRAAQKCGVTQSTISRQIQALEAALGMPLFHRLLHAKLTLGGDRLLPRAKKICQEWQQVNQEIAELLAGKQPELCVAAIHSVCAYYLPPILQQFYRDYNQVQLRVTALGSDRALKVLKDGLVDLVIVMNNRFLTSNGEMVVDALYDESIEVLMAANHPLAKSEVISWEAIAKYPQVVFKDGYGMQRIIREQFERRGLNLHAALELNTPDAFRGVVRQGEMIALLPQSALVEARLDPTLTVKAIAHADSLNLKEASEQPLKRQVVLVTTEDRLQIPPIRHLWQLIRHSLPHQFQDLNQSLSPLPVIPNLSLATGSTLS